MCGFCLFFVFLFCLEWIIWVCGYVLGWICLVGDVCCVLIGEYDDCVDCLN